MHSGIITMQTENSLGEHLERPKETLWLKTVPGIQHFISMGITAGEHSGSVPKAQKDTVFTPGIPITYVCHESGLLLRTL